MVEELEAKKLKKANTGIGKKVGNLWQLLL
jgi:hypothetical protein